MDDMKTGKRAAGFTMVEVLASMAVLIVLVLALTRMFAESSSITRRGTTMLMRNSTGTTAMESLLQAAEGMIVNERLACYVLADSTDPAGFGFDEVWFISTSGDQDDDMPYEYFRFYVTNSIVTNSKGATYMRFSLIKDRMIFAVGDYVIRPQRFYALDPAYSKWWMNARQFPGNVWDRDVLADNVVRFDIYCLGWDGQGWMAQSGTLHEFDSTQGPSISGMTPAQKAKLSNIPPAAFDIYLQIASPEAALEGGMALLSDDADVRTKGRELMIRDSSSLFGRAVPIVGSAQYNRAMVYGTNNTSYYMP